MVKKLLISTAIYLSGYAAFSQNADSLALISAKWNKQKIASRIELVSCHFNSKNLFAANENISYLEIKSKGRSPVFSLGAEENLLKKTSTFGTESNAIAAINGSFFDVKKGGSVDFIKVNGRVLSENRLDNDNHRARHQQAAITIEKGKLRLAKWDGTPDWEQKLKAGDILLSGPMLTWNKKDEPLDTTSFTNSRHPRTCIGIKPNGKIILLTVDGRNDNSDGMSLPELARTMRWLGCTSAINLDGGGSTTLWIRGFPGNGVVNYPTDNKKWDHDGERKVANVIFLKNKP